MDTSSEQDYAMASGKNGAMPAKLGSKEGSNRDGTRGASEDVAGDGGGEPANRSAYSFYGDSDGRNDDTANKPVDKGHSKSTLDAPPHSASVHGGTY